MNNDDATDSTSLEMLIEQAQQGDVSTLPAIRELLDKVETWEDSRILAKQIERSWINTISGQDLITKEFLEREVDALRVQLHAGVVGRAAHGPAPHECVHRVLSGQAEVPTANPWICRSEPAAR